MPRPTLMAVGLFGLAIAGLAATGARAASPGTIYLPVVQNSPPPLFADDFSNPASGWPTTPQLDPGGRVIATRGYVGGTYQVLFSQDASLFQLYGFYVPAQHSLLVGDFQVGADVWPASANSDGTIGVYFDNSSTTGFYDFEVGLGGYYLARYSYPAQAWTTVIPFTPSGTVLGGNQVNRVEVVRQGASISLYANDALLAQVADSTFPDGFVGLAASNDVGSVGFDARFDNFALYALGPVPTGATTARTQTLGTERAVPIPRR
jgi:hypothetical protein